MKDERAHTAAIFKSAPVVLAKISTRSAGASLGGLDVGLVNVAPRYRDVIEKWF